MKISALALVSAILTVLLRKYNPEIGVLLSMSAILTIFALSSGLLDSINDLTELVKTIASPSDMFIVPVIKCLGISIVTRVSAELCRDSAQSASAAALEFAGAACAMAVSMPMMISMLKMVSAFV